MSNLKSLQAQAVNANTQMQNEFSFSVEYQRKGIIIDNIWVSNCYILKEGGEIEQYGTPSEIIERMQEITDHAVQAAEGF